MTSKRKNKVAVFVSGAGSNLSALLKAQALPNASYDIALVCSNIPDCLAIQLAQQHDIKTDIIDNYDTLTKTLESLDIDWICLAGFMKIIPADFVSTWHNKIINIHPSLLPKFRGLRALRRSYESGDHIIGCTIHMVRSQVDVGPIICRGLVNRLSYNNYDDIVKAIHRVEHACYPFALNALSRKEIVCEGDKTIFTTHNSNTLIIDQKGDIEHYG